ncbi:hypothetical protein L3Y34_014259 [Caenorhabditis briggsae]|uniref:Uncharacterized protein n=1 Tax=Caenorhabditis briggsae TaxID=6238 RepID=A0AAE9DSG4_CAEBR|nr:hypothetical protein L3Y34_014259 [Caenorhabditis briggsae]
MAFAGLADLRLFDNVSQYINTLAGEFSPDTSHLHDHNCKCSIVDRLWCDYFGTMKEPRSLRVHKFWQSPSPGIMVDNRN